MPNAEAASLQWRAVADQIRPKVPKLATIMDDAEPDVLAYMTFPKEHRAKLHSTDEIDKPSASDRGNLPVRGRPRGEARCIGWKRRRAAYSSLAGLRRPRALSLGGRGRQIPTKCS